MLLPQAGFSYLLLALLFASHARADQLNCNDPAWAKDKVVISSWQDQRQTASNHCMHGKSRGCSWSCLSEVAK